MTAAFHTRWTNPLATRPVALAAVDLNGDGRLDLAVASADAGLSTIVNAGLDSFPIVTEYEAGAEPRDLAVGDLNGDGQPDVARI